MRVFAEFGILADAILFFLQPEVTQEGEAKYKQTLNKTFLGDHKCYN